MNLQPPDEVRFRRRIPVSAILLFIIGAFIAVAGKDDSDSIPFAVTFLALAATVWASAPAGFTLRFHPDEIENRETGLRVPYHAITFLRLTNRALFDYSAGKATEMHIGHPRGCWRLGKRAQIPRNELYEFLLAKSRLLEPPAILPGQLREVYEREVADFGAEQVLASCGREVSAHEVQRVRALWFIVIALLLGAAAGWAVNAGDGMATTFAAMICAFGFIAFLFTILFSAQRRALRKMREACGIVISPRGLTMESPILKGVITWEEVKDVATVNRAYALTRGLIVKIEGGQFSISDHYTCPVTEIHRRIVDYRAFERRGN